MTSNIGLTRDSVAWVLGILASLGVYLMADGRPPTEWHYGDWLKFLAAVISTVSGKLAASPLPHSTPDVNQGGFR